MRPASRLEPKLARRGEKATLRHLLAHLEALERDWDDATRRERALEAARRFARDVAAAEIALPPGARDLPRRLAGRLGRRDLAALCVPLERALERRMRDEDFLPATDAQAPRAPRMPVRVVAESLRSAFNVGGLFRTAECFGVEEILLAGYTATPDDARVARAAMGTEQRVAWRSFRTAHAAVAELRAAGAFIVALESGDEHSTLAELAPRFPCALLVGNERFGLSPSLVAAAEARARIPSYGAKASLNVVAALAIALYELRRRYDGT